MPSRSTAKVTSTSAKTSTAGASSGSFTREWASLPARLFLLRNRNVASCRGELEALAGGRPWAQFEATPTVIVALNNRSRSLLHRSRTTDLSMSTRVLTLSLLPDRDLVDRLRWLRIFDGKLNAGWRARSSYGVGRR